MKIIIIVMFSSFLTTTFSFSQESIAVLVIDVQRLGGNENISVIKELLNEQNKVIEWANKHNIEVLYVEESGQGPTSYLLNQDQKKANTTFIKNKYNLFEDDVAGKRAVKYLKEREISKLIVLGTQGGACVSQTISGGICNNFEVYTSPTLYANTTPRTIEYPCQIFISAEERNGPLFHSFDTTSELLKHVENEILR